MIKKHGGLWEFLGGKIEGNESSEICIKREIKEKLSITIEIIKEMNSYYTLKLRWIVIPI